MFSIMSAVDSTLNGDGFCAQTVEIWEFVGTILSIIKIVIPIIIIILGAIDLGKAVVSSDEGEIKKASSSLLRRFIAGVLIFFIPTLINAAFGLFDRFVDLKNGSDYQICFDCVAGNDCNTSSSSESGSSSGTDASGDSEEIN